jgi:hypothetical protein
MERLSFGRALYYPHIFPQNRRWLRTAALYYDGISRIVPADFLPTSYDRHNGVELERDFEELSAVGFIRDEHPERYLNEVGNSFLDFLIPLLDGPDSSTKLRSKLGSNQWKPYNMYRAKISPSLVSFLEEQGLVRSPNDYEVEFDAAIGGLYMLFLANMMASQQPIVSDNPIYEMLACSDLVSNTASSTDRGILLANSIFLTAVPVDVESIDIHDLIRFRNDHEQERTEFYDWIASYSADLSKITNATQLQDAVQHYGVAISAKMSAFDNKLGALGLKTATGIFSFSVPGALTATWGFATKDPHLLLLGGGLALAGIVGNAVMDRKVARKESPLSYVHSLRRGMSPQKYATDLIELHLRGI